MFAKYPQDPIWDAKQSNDSLSSDLAVNGSAVIENAAIDGLGFVSPIFADNAGVAVSARYLLDHDGKLAALGAGSVEYFDGATKTATVNHDALHFLSHSLTYYDAIRAYTLLDYFEATGFVAIAYSDDSAASHVATFSADGRLIDSKELTSFSSANMPSSVRVASILGAIYAYSVSSATNALQCHAIDASGNISASATDVTGATPIDSSFPFFDVLEVGESGVVALRSQGTYRIVVDTFATATSIGSTTSPGNAVPVEAISLIEWDNKWFCVWSETNGTSQDVYAAGDGIAATLIGAYTGSAPVVALACHASNEGVLALWEVPGVDPDIAMQVLDVTTTISCGEPPTAVSIWALQARLMGYPINEHVPISTIANAYQQNQCGYLLSIENGRPNGKYLPWLALAGYPRVFPRNGANTLPQTCLFQKRRDQSRLAVCVLSLSENPETLSAATIGDMTHIGGSLPLVLTAADVLVEDGFTQAPDSYIATATTLSGGSLAASSTYRYKFRYRCLDTGQHSLTNPTECAPSTGANNAMQLEIQSLLHSRKGNIEIDIYRTEAGSSGPYYIVGTVVNDISQKHTLFFDKSMSDANLVRQPALEVGGPLSFGPKPYRLNCIHQDRWFYAASEEPDTVYYSREDFQASDELLIPANGSVVAIGSASYGALAVSTAIGTSLYAGRGYRDFEPTGEYLVAQSYPVTMAQIEHGLAVGDDGKLYLIAQGLQRLPVDPLLACRSIVRNGTEYHCQASDGLLVLSAEQPLQHSKITFAGQIAFIGGKRYRLSGAYFYVETATRATMRVTTGTFSFPRNARIMGVIAEMAPGATGTATMTVVRDKTLSESVSMAIGTGNHHKCRFAKTKCQSFRIEFSTSANVELHRLYALTIRR